MDDDTFELVRDCFEHDDGSLPSIELAGLTRSQVAAIYAFIRRGSHVSTRAPEFWDKRRQQSVALDAVANAADMVAGLN
ncbi:MAG TPA: hypothetical protein VK324_15065 [Tepidisphaeraceae bacterium]|nr:hypothetical protein [Tepidisphaeraceae bacterium]